MNFRNIEKKNVNFVKTRGRKKILGKDWRGKKESFGKGWVRKVEFAQRLEGKRRVLAKAG